MGDFMILKFPLSERLYYIFGAFFLMFSYKSEFFTMKIFSDATIIEICGCSFSSAESLITRL